MSDIEAALLFDAQDQPVQAIEAYERAIASPRADLDSYINLAVLYFQCFDFGYAAHHKLPDGVIRASLDRALELLDLGEARFSPHPEAEFWRRYIRKIYLGGPDFFDEAKEMIASGKTNVPSFYLIHGPHGRSHVEDALALLEDVKNGRTEKERYIRSVMGSHVNDELLGKR